MVPFSFKPELSYSQVMNKTFFDHRSVEAGSLALEIGCPFLPSCLPYFNPGPGFLYLLCACGQSAFVSGAAPDLERFKKYCSHSAGKK
jgi:hypothetical protein